MTKIAKIYKGIISLNNGEYEVSSYVIDDGEKVERVLSQKEVVRLITGGRESGDINRYLSANNIQPFLPEHMQGGHKGLKINGIQNLENNMVLDDKNSSNILVFKIGHNVVNGIRANDVIDICNAYLKARQAGVLTHNQYKLAEQSEIFISASAKTGIEAVVDEATGYQYFRKADELQSKLDAHIQEGYREWTKTFPEQFFMHLYRLEGQPLPLHEKYYPQRFGKYVMQFVYDTLDPDIADYLRTNNPKPQGIKHHHQKFTDYGYKVLTDHLMSIIGVMKASPNMDKFKENIAFAYPNARTQQRARQSKLRTLRLQNASFPPTSGEITAIQQSLFGNNLQGFDKSIKQALDYNPKEN
jgi:hypothetical protein